MAAMDAFTPQQTIELVSRIGTKKAHMRIDKLWWNSFMTGPLLGFGCAWLVSTNASPWYQENAPGLIRTIGALVFPVGLVMIVLTGSDLFTSNIMFMITAFLHRRVSVLDVLKSWFVSFFGNLAGTLFFMAIITGYGGVFEESEAYRNAAINIAMQKAYDPQWHQIFLRAIGANWLVCVAVFLSISARDIAGKIVAIWTPCACFVGLALDHTIANMYFIPNGIWNGAPFGVGYYIWKSMIPTVLGNFVGGGLFVGTMYWYLYLTGEKAVQVSFDLGPLQTAMDGSGPTRRSNGNAGPRPSHATNGTLVEGKDPEEDSPISSPAPAGYGAATPRQVGQLSSALGSELHDGSPYAMTHAERTKGRKTNAKDHV